MSKSQLKEIHKVLGQEGQSFKAFQKEETRRCKKALSEAIEAATKDHNGKPVFYTVLRHISKSGMSRVISIHYIDMEAGEFRNINYAASILLNLRMDRIYEGVRIKGCGMDMGFAIIYDLACTALDDGYGIIQRWI